VCVCGVWRVCVCVCVDGGAFKVLQAYNTSMRRIKNIFRQMFGEFKEDIR